MSDHDGLILLTCPESLADSTCWLHRKSMRAKNYINIYIYTSNSKTLRGRRGALIKNLVVNQNIVTGVNFVECLNM